MPEYLKYIWPVIGRLLFILVFSLDFCGAGYCGRLFPMENTDTLLFLQRLEFNCQRNLQHGELDSLRKASSELIQLSGDWLKSRPSNPKGIFYLMAGILHRSNVFHLTAKNEEALGGYEKALELSLQIGDTVKRHMIYNNLGIQHHQAGNYEKAISYHYSALRERLRINDSLFIGDTYNSLGSIYFELNRIPQSYRYHKLAFRYRKATRVPPGKLADTYNQLGRIAMKTPNWNQAIVAFSLAWQIYAQQKDNQGKMFILNNLAVVLSQFNLTSKSKLLFQYALKIIPDSHSVFAGDIHMNLGSFWLNSGQLLHAKWHFTQSKIIYARLGNAYRMALLDRLWANLFIANYRPQMARQALRQAMIYFKGNGLHKEYSEALLDYAQTYPFNYSDSAHYFFNQLLDCIEENKLNSWSGQSYLAIGEFYLKQGRFQDAKWMYQRASSSAIESKNLNQLNSAHLGLLSCFHEAGNDEAVKKESQWFKRVTDSIGNKGTDIAEKLSLLIDSYSSKQSLLKEINREYNYRRSQREVQREYGLALLAVLLALAISAIVLLLAYIKKKEQHNVRVKLESDLAGLKGMINQHFIANTMNAIKSLVAQNKNDTADVYLNKFSALLRGVLQQSKNTLISLGDELQFLRLYIDLEQLRFTGQIEFNLLVDPQIDPSNVLIPAMIMQPIVENSIQHGRKGESGPLNLNIKIFKQGLVLVCLLEDDGIGFEASQIEQKGAHTSFGLELTKQRIKLLGNHLDVPVDFHVEEIIGLGGRVEGTRVILQIPLTITPFS